MVVLTILVVAVSIFSRIVVSTSRLRETNRENAIAGEAARMLLERMRGGDYGEIFARYNSDPNDDPGGAGTAHGDRFVVAGLKPLSTSEDGTMGRIFFPTIAVSEEALCLDGDPKAPDGGAPDGGAAGGGATGGVATGGKGAPLGGVFVSSALAIPPRSYFVPLREDCVYPLLGMPRDLNGDSIIDQADHASDFLILPVQIRIEWEGRVGPQHVDLFTMLTRFKKSE